MALSKEDMGLRIKEARTVKAETMGKKYTGQMLADDIGISRGYLGDMESGRIYPNYEMLTAIAKACDVPLSFFDERGTVNMKELANRGITSAEDTIETTLLLGEKLRNLRRENDITQEHLSEIIGVSTSMIGMYETNARKPSYEILLKISEYFNVSTDYLLGNDEKFNIESNKEIGITIKNKREALNLSQQEVADYVKVSKSAISKWESGEIANIDRPKLQLLSEILKTSPFNIMMGIEEEETDSSSFEEEELSAGELMQYFRENKEKLSALSREEKDKLIKLIDLYLD